MTGPKEFIVDDNLRGFEVQFKTTWGLFAYQKIDNGTRLLIEKMEIENGDLCVDLGCGYGPIGITMAKLNKDGRVWMIDRDIVAGEYAMINSTLNRVKNTEVMVGNGLMPTGDKKFDVIAANLPTHMGQEMLKWLIGEARTHLKPGGSIQIVVEKRLENFIKQVSANRCIQVAQGAAHKVWRLEA